MASGGPIVVGGEALIDLVRGDASSAFRAYPGGGPYNTARSLARLEQRVHFLGSLSTDAFGAELRKLLQRDGVRLESVVTTSLPTTLAVAELDPAGAARYSFYTEGTSAAALSAEEALAALPSDLAVLHIGTLGLVIEPMASALRAVVEAVADRALVMVDPNCRPPLIPDREAYRNSLSRTLRRAHVVKASDEDLRWLGAGADPIQTARSLLEEGPRVVLVTVGGNGAVVVMGDGEWAVRAPSVHVVDTIGAGDAFGAGFLAWWTSRRLSTADLADGQKVKDATRFACVVAARTCERAGADPPRLDEVEGRERRLDSDVV